MKKILISLILCTLLLSGCANHQVTDTTLSEEETTQTTLSDTTEKIFKLGMPEVVFIKFYFYPDGEHNTTKGYFIDNNGTLKRFQLYNDNLFNYKEIISSSSDNNGRILYKYDLSEMLPICDKFDENSSVCHPDFLEKNVLEDYYKTLLSIDKEYEVKRTECTNTIIQNQYGLYGVRKNEDGEEKMVLISEYGGEWFVSSDDNANYLSDQLKDVFPKIGGEQQDIPAWAK